MGRGSCLLISCVGRASRRGEGTGQPGGGLRQVCSNGCRLVGGGDEGEASLVPNYALR
jgi:hypothetical protein